MKPAWERSDAVLGGWVLGILLAALLNPIIPRLIALCVILSAIIMAIAWRFYPQRRDASIAFACIALTAVSAPWGLFVAVPLALVYGVITLVRHS